MTTAREAGSAGPAAAAASTTVEAMQRAIDAGALPDAIALGVEQSRLLAPAQRGSVLATLAFAYAANGQLAEALRAAAAARDLAREHGDRRLEVEAVLATATTLNSAEDHAGVIQLIEAVEPIIDELDDPALQAQALRRLGVSCSIVGEHARGIAYLDRAHDLFTAAGEHGHALALRNSMLNARVRQLDTLAEEDPRRAAGNAAVLDEWRELAAQYEAAGNRRMALMARGNYAICAWQAGQPEQALDVLDDLLPRYAEAGMRPNVVITHNHRGHVLRRLGRLDEARAAYGAVLADAGASPRERCDALDGTATVLEAQDEARAALAAIKELRALERQLDDMQARLRAHQRELRLEIARLNAHWSKLASEDTLTGLPNRRALEAWLPAALARAAEGQPLALLLIDADHFKSVNDRHGHAVGDAVLRQLAQLLRASCRYDDLPARLGGEEFVLALPNTPLAAALQSAERLRDLVQRHPWHELLPGLKVTVSIGVAGSDALPAASLAADMLLGRADERLYEAKRGGRNRVAG